MKSSILKIKTIIKAGQEKAKIFSQKFKDKWEKYSPSKRFLICGCCFSFFLVAFCNFYFYKTIFQHEASLYLASIFTIILFLEYLIIYSILSVRFLKITIPIIIILSVVANFYMLTCNTYIGYSVIISVLQTNLREAKETLNYKIILLFLLIISFFFVKKKLNIFVDFKNTLQSIKIRVITIFVSLFIAGLIIFLNYRSISTFVRSFSSFAFSINLNNYSFNTYRIIRDIVRTPKELQIIDTKPTIKNKDKKRFVVFLVGETSRAMNYSLNGYDRKTNPYLEKDGVISFKNTRSCATYTAKSVPCIFSPKGQAKFKESDNDENVMDLLRKAGVYTKWYENDDGCKGVCKRIETINVQARKHKLCNDGECKDEILIQDLKNEVEKFEKGKNKNAIIVMHMIGSHGPLYHLRYAKEFAKFKPECTNSNPAECSKEELANAYDNTILYQDFVIHKIIELLKNMNKNNKKNNKNTEITLMFVSDHGESLGENGAFLHAFPYGIAPKEQTNVPFVFWTNNEKLKKTLFLKQNQQTSHDNIFHTLLGLFDINSIAKNDSLDLTL